jgi:hypothetical protein
MTHPSLLTSETRLGVNDLYLGSYLLLKGGHLIALRFDEGGRATLIFEGPDLPFHRKAYGAGEVCVFLPAVKAQYNRLRDILTEYQRMNHNPKDKTYAYPRSEDQIREGLAEHP